MALCLVTGGAGFIGSHLVEALVDRGHDVRVLDNFSTGNWANLTPVHKDVKVIPGDITDLKVVRKAVKDVELVFHRAAFGSVPGSVQDPVAVHDVCATGTLHLLMAAREAQVQRVIYSGSSSAYGNASHCPQRETDPIEPRTPYAVAKLTGEEYCAAFSHVYGLETVRLRYFNVFGPRQTANSSYAGVIPQFIEAMLAGKTPIIHGDGLQTRDFTFVSDVVQANLLAAEAPRVSGQVYNIASGRGTSLLEIVDLLNDLLGTHLRPIHGAPRVGDVRRGQADISRAQTQLGYCPCTNLKNDLQVCIDHSASLRIARSRQTSSPETPVLTSSIGV